MTTAAEREILDKLTELRPQFPRAGEDIDAVALRMSTGDYKGVLQATRLVLEIVLRDLIVRVLEETPGKRTVDQLMQRINKQQGEETLVPIRVIAHMRTLQAWGNVGAHDHGGSLFEEPEGVVSEDAFNSLNSLVAVLAWYRSTHLADVPASAAAATSPSTELAPATAIAVPAKKGRGILIAVVALAVVAAVLALIFGLRGGSSQRAMALRQQLDEAVQAEDDPLAPATCRTEDAALLELLASAATSLKGGAPGGARPQDEQALGSLQAVEAEAPKAGEYWWLLAKARLFAGQENVAVRQAAENALAHCENMAAAKNILGTTYLRDGETDAARAAYGGAIELAEGYMAPRFNLALLDLQSGRVDQAIETFDAFLTMQPNHLVARQARARARLSKNDAAGAKEDLETVIRLSPDDAEAHLLLGLAHSKLGDADAATAAYCKAKELGHPKAAGLCKP